MKKRGLNLWNDFLAQPPPSANPFSKLLVKKEFKSSGEVSFESVLDSFETLLPSHFEALFLRIFSHPG